MNCIGGDELPPEIRPKSPSPPFWGEREGPTPEAWEGEVGGAADQDIGPPHPALSPQPVGGEGKASGYVNPIADLYLIFGQALRPKHKIHPSRLGRARPGGWARIETTGLHSGLASFETRPLGAPQDEGKALMALRKLLILRRPQSGRLEGRTAPDPANHGFLAQPRQRNPPPVEMMGFALLNPSYRCCIILNTGEAKGE